MRLFSLPAGLLGIALAILFFAGYGRLTRPVVASPVQRVIDQYAQGVQLGGKVKSVRERLAARLQYVPHLGYIANVGAPRSGWPAQSQLWLLLNAKDREKRDPASARVDAVEILSAAPEAYSTLAGNIMYIFAKSPLRGCLLMSRPGTFRHVLVWTTARDRGGIAVTSDDTEDSDRAPGGTTVTTMLAYAGKFDSSRTLRGEFKPSACDLVVLQRNRGTRDPTAAENTFFAFADSMAGTTPARAPQPSSTDTLLNACASPEWNPEGWHETRAGQLRILLPPGFPEASSGGSSGPPYHWALWGGGADLQIFEVSSERDSRISGGVTSTCSWNVPQGRATVRLGEKRDYRGQLFVSAYFVAPRRPAFAIVGTTTDVRRQAMLLRAIQAAIKSPAWSLRP
jgi:hypothetical protein